MKSKLLYLILTLAINCYAYAYEYPIPYRIGNKFTYSDVEGNVLFDKRFDWASLFHDGLATIKIGEKYGVIDVNGNWILNADFRKIGIGNEKNDFIIAAVGDTLKYKIFSRSGELIYPDEVDYISAKFNTYSNPGINSKGIGEAYTQKAIILWDNDRRAVINLNGEFIFPFDVHSFVVHQDFILKSEEGKNDSCARSLHTITGKKITDCIGAYPQFINDMGIAVIRKHDSLFVFDKVGSLLIKLSQKSYKHYNPYKRDLIRDHIYFCKPNQYHKPILLIKNTGEVLVNNLDSLIYQRMNDSLIYIGDIYERGIIKTDGTWFIEPSSSLIANNYRNFYYISNNGNGVFYNLSMDTIANIKAGSLDGYSFEKDHIRPKLIKCIAPDGKYIIFSLERKMKCFSDIEDLPTYFWKKFGVFEFKKNGLWGLKDTLNNIIISAKYDSLMYYEYDISYPRKIAYVMGNSKWGAIDLIKNKETDIEYDEIKALGEYYYLAQKNSNRKIIDADGNDLVVIPDSIESVIPFGKLIQLSWKRGGKNYFKFIDTDGNEIEIFKGNASIRYFNDLYYSIKDEIVYDSDFKKIYYSDYMDFAKVNDTLVEISSGIYNFIKKEWVYHPDKFIEVEHYQNELFIAQTETGYGLINARNEWIIQPHLKQLEPWWKGSDKLIFTVADGKTGLVDSEGNSIIEAIYNGISTRPLRNEKYPDDPKLYRAYVETGYALLNENGEQTLHYEMDGYPRERKPDGYWTIFRDAALAEMMEAESVFIDLFDQPVKITASMIEGLPSQTYGAMTTDGRLICLPIYRSIRKLTDELFLVKLEYDDEKIQFFIHENGTHYYRKE